jgi:hypothetical protein
MNSARTSQEEGLAPAELVGGLIDKGVCKSINELS